MQFLRWLWVLHLSLENAVATVLLRLFIFFNLQKKRKGISCSAEFLISLLTDFCPGLPLPLQFILREQPEWAFKTHQILNLFHSKNAMALPVNRDESPSFMPSTHTFIFLTVLTLWTTPSCPHLLQPQKSLCTPSNTPGRLWSQGTCSSWSLC